jgi:iron complex outermembrane receptor protein
MSRPSPSICTAESRGTRAARALAFALLLVSMPHLAAALEEPGDLPPEAAATAPAEATGNGGEQQDTEPAPEGLRFGEELEVLDRLSPPPAIEILGREAMPTMPSGDGADLLRGLAGVSLGRMGGHGLEPRIRGLGESNLNILIDGAYIHGGCPNRMDPPTSFAATGGFDRITVVKGVQSLRYGTGGSAGTVLFERQTPLPGGDRPWRTEASAGYGSWSAGPELGLNAIYARESFYLRADAESRRLDSYEDGSGEIVRSAFESRVTSLMVGVGDHRRGLLEVGYERSRTDDALFGGAGMDSPYDRGETYRLKLRREEVVGPWSDLQADLFLSRVDHLMDNYSLRPLVAPMAMRVPTTSDTVGGRASGRLGIGDRLLLTLGLDYQRNERRALRYAGPNAAQVTMLQSVMWPDAELVQAGLFVEGDRSLGRDARVRFGVRLDAFEASADQSDLAPAGRNLSPNQLYELYYGRTAAPWSDTGVSALLRYELSLGPGWTLFTGVSRRLGAPDATARYLGAGSADPSRRWVGNPALDVAAHHQIDLGIAAATQRRSWSATAFLDRVDDFALRDRARSQPGILLSDRASIYRNVDALLVGLEMDGRWAPSDTVTLRGNAAWVRGDNRTDDRPLAQMPPLQGIAAADLARGPWRSTAAVRWALEQDRVDDDPRTGSGLDFGPTPGHTVLDLQVARTLGRGLEVLAGIDNLFDETYADHLSRGNLFDPDPVRVNEPGRAAWLRLRWLGGGDRAP